ncbi:MAG: phosphotransferase [Cyclobacteriaceae bacterium]
MDFFLQGYVDGTLLTNRIYSNDRERIIDAQKRMVTTLCDIQAWAHISSGYINDQKRYRKSNLNKRLRRNWDLTKDLLISYILKSDMVSMEDIDFIDNAIDRIDISCLSLEFGKNVVIHGDYKSDNIIETNTGDLVVIDWLSMSYGPPWHDLAAVLDRSDWNSRKLVLKHYLDSINRTSFDVNTTLDQACEYLRCAIIFKTINNLEELFSRGFPEENFQRKIIPRVSLLKEELQTFQQSG